MSSHVRTWIVGGLTLVLAGLPVGPALAQDPPFERGLDAACPAPAQLLDLYLDVADGVHASAVSCITYYDIAEGRVGVDGRVYAPGEPVTRAQMASFIARTMELVTQEELPATEEFPDDGGTHQANIRKLATAGVVEGFDDGTYRQDLAVTRAQMASFIARALESLLEEPLNEAPVFDDVDDGDAHASTIAKLASVGVVVGQPDGTYRPGQEMNRAQMGSFIARGLDVVADRGVFPEFVTPVDGTPTTELSEQEPTEAGLLGVTDVSVGAHRFFDRLTFEVEGDGTVGWRVDYVDEARSQGSGELIDVTGEAILRVAITGVAIPPDLPEGIDVWEEERLDGPADSRITEVVNDSIFEGQHVFFVGTGGEWPFVVQRLSDPQRIVVDVFRGFEPAQQDPGAPETVSSFTTPLVPGQDRNANVHLAADLIDGDVIPPGSSYSLNAGIGPRTSERGFVSNGYIDDDGDVISVVGGGVSQVATTFVNTAWFAGIDVADFRPHTRYFERYPMCHEATIVWETLDVVVTNDSPNDITIATSHTADSVTISFVSHPWAEVESWTGEPLDVVGGAFSVSCGRTITYPDGTTEDETYSWRYDAGFPG